jgi:hypothetical protein
MKSEIFDMVYGIVGFALIVVFIGFPHENARKYAHEKGISTDVAIGLACHERTACPKLREVREQCAVAQDFDRCVSVRMENEQHFWCTQDGKSERIERISPNIGFCAAEKSRWMIEDMMSK